MIDNPLLNDKSPIRKSGRATLQWAESARAKGLAEVAAAWEKAASEGWDDLHYAGVRDHDSR